MSEDVVSVLVVIESDIATSSKLPTDATRLSLTLTEDTCKFSMLPHTLLSVCTVNEFNIDCPVI